MRGAEEWMWLPEDKERADPALRWFSAVQIHH